MTTAALLLAALALAGLAITSLPCSFTAWDTASSYEPSTMTTSAPSESIALTRAAVVLPGTKIRAPNPNKAAIRATARP